jgi:hypothetical protein
MRTPTELEAAQGWRSLAELPEYGTPVDVMGSDFMGDWQGTAYLKLLSPAGPRIKWVGMGWMGTREREITKGDVELWRPKPAAQPPKER